ncbi:hypothetical protein O9X98_06235 [Agrobacterium salinitolerans]|nr:hypothetical protein [Agrobacterium salinitolerans]
MTVRDQVIKVFPASKAARYSIFDMASVLWPKQEAEKLQHVSSWTEILDMPVGDMGPTGIGALLMFMEADLAVAYLPAWLVMSYEHSFPFAGVLPSLVRVLDNEGDMDVEDRERFDTIRAGITVPQRLVIASVLNEMADVHFSSKPDLKEHLQRIAAYWKAHAS